MNQEIINELNERCPIKFDQDRLDKLESTTKMLHERDGKYVKEFYSSIYHFLNDVPDKLKQKFVIVSDKYRLAGAGISIVYELPPAKAKQKLAESLDKVRVDYQSDIEAKQQRWIEDQLQTLLDEEKAQTLAKVEEREREFKRKLLDAMRK
ncbi:hypothetical protein R8N45_20030 [Vibrio sp. 1403]|uniref:hypothetical protein n=1 Tax=Vibrio TaxID=662 RepID=UPI00111D6E6D|nr:MULTISPECIES: hypothetical protein [Vibrio]ELA9814830.1 hypothetical protein [Vibrio parahaemolyticus]ELA9889754.1 hypothetical protein [Vibrio parahaemolyticus]MBE4151378.1 hypothetical protein [Vibrio parahaemolyticus]MBO0200057.1 hypothetical protein [Vibrio alginolyticus]MCI9705779.1 hypothetical protein [Vibrio parahaemolyticus]